MIARLPSRPTIGLADGSRGAEPFEMARRRIVRVPEPASSHSYPVQLLAVLALCLIGMSLTACYETEQEIIPVELGDPVPFEHEVIVWEGNEDGTHFGRTATGNDYRYENHREDEVDTGALRALHLKDGIFAVQVHPDDADYYKLLFYRIEKTGVRRVEAASTAQVAALAARSGVKLAQTPWGYAKMTGETAAMLAFVRGHAALEFREWQRPPRRPQEGVRVAPSRP